MNHTIARANWQEKVRERRLATVASKGSLFFLARLYHALIQSTAKRFCD